MAENFVNIIRDIRGSTNNPATDTSCIYGDMKSMHKEYKGFKQITDEERLKLENIEEGATKNSTDSFLLARENHTGNMSIANVQDTPSRMAMTIHEKNKLEAINVNATVNDTDANLRNRATHTGTQSADSIVDGLVNAAYTLQEKNKLSVLSTTVPPAHTHDNTSIINLSYSKLTNVPETFYPSEHLHSMNEITTGNLDASRINQTNSMQFVNSIEKEKITNAESMNNKGTPFGYAPLDGNGKINPSYLDALNVIDVFTPINQEAMFLLTSAKPGDIAYVQDSENTYMLVALPVHLQDNWKQMNSGSGVITFNGLNGIVSVGTDEIPEGSANVYFTNERVDDRVANLLAPGTNVSIVYNDDTNQIIINANDTSVKWSEIQNKPNTKIDVNLSGEISGSGSVTLSQLGDGTLNIENITSDTYELRNSNIQWHIAHDKTNPHNVTKDQVGLGNADNTPDSEKVVFSAGKLITPRDISISGDASGSTSFDGDSNVDIVITVADNSHKHTIENITGLPETNINRADKWLSAQNIARMVMQDGLLVKIRYNQDVDQDYELLSYDNITGNLTNISHYIEGEYMGITNFEYADGDLVSVIFVGV